MINQTDIATVNLPALVIKGVVPLPNNIINLTIIDDVDKKAAKEAVAKDGLIVLLVLKKIQSNDVKPEDINKNGIIGRITSTDEKGKLLAIKIEGIVRCSIIEYNSMVPFVKTTVMTKPSTSSDMAAETAGVRLLVKEIETSGPKVFKNNPAALKTISGGITADKLCDILAYNLTLDINSKLKYVNEPDISTRLTYILEDLKRERYLSAIEDDIEEKVRKEINQSQKEYYLREKMKTIRNELGDTARKDAEVEKLKKAISEAKMPKAIEEKALTELGRYSDYSTNSGEGGIIYSYLEFLIKLPWYKEAQNQNSIVKAKEQLDADHYGLEKVKDRILEYLAVCILTKKTPQAILCLVGPPGVGKTSLARSIARALNKPFIKQSLGGMKDESEIRGHRRTYLGALPGRILQGMTKAKVVNPVFLLDEIDKLSSDYRGDPASALLEVLDSEQNQFFSDNYLEEQYDLSKVFFITTANYLEDIPAALRDRLEIVQLSSYTEYEKFEIARKHLIDKQLILNGLSKTDFKISDAALWMVIREYTMEAGVRELERIIGSLIRKSIKIILEDAASKVDVNKTNLKSFLGNPKYTYNRISTTDQVGVVNGLAYTQYGGDTLQIEATYYPGSGKLLLTGKLGDVMKESAYAAISYIKANAKKLGIDAKVFRDNDIHIHVPEGAVPKDGPSAGVALATALVSVFTNRPVDHLVGMTGEIVLTGNVLPIGGLREKSIAAHRSGLKTIIIPKDNLKDIEDVPASVLEELNVICVKQVDEIFKLALKDN